MTVANTAYTPADVVEAPIRLPSAPEPPEPPQFPAIAMLAPVALGLTLFLVIGSPYLLMFMFFGPVLMLAQQCDRRIGGKRRMRRKQLAFDQELELAQDRIEAAKTRLLQRLRQEQPLTHDLLAERRLRAGDTITLGTTTVRSGLQLEGGSSSVELEEARTHASRLEHAPLGWSAASLLGLHGPPVVVTGIARSLIVQLTSRNASAALVLTGEVPAELLQAVRDCGVEVNDSVDTASECRGLAFGSAAEAASTHLVAHPDGSAELVEASGQRTSFQAESIGATPLRNWLTHVISPQQQLHRLRTAIPQSCALADLLRHPDKAADTVDSAAGLRAAFARDARESFEIDLVSDGPHAVIGGTTGSGKSELLVAWATALAHRYTADQCQLLCLDFKGGATFDALTPLPHCIGVVTDLDTGQAQRVLTSLQAELRRREQQLRDLQIRDVRESGGVMSRLVVMVDEYQALVAEHPELAEVFADIGARGRSLGIHLVLCTQRPTGVFRESLLANCSIRLSLRVEQPSDSATLLGCDSASRLAPHQRGRLLGRIGGAELTEVQVALATREDIHAIAAAEFSRRAEAGFPEVASCWQPPLPDNLPRRPKHWATIDEPEYQRQYDLPPPASGEHLWIVGGPRSGKTTAMMSIAAAANENGATAHLLGRCAETTYDFIEQLREHTKTGDYVLIDDLDAIEQQLDEVHRGELIHRLARALRTPSGCTFVIASARTAGSLQRLHSLTSVTLRLPTPTKNEWLLQGGEGRDYRELQPPGRGRYGRALAQVMMPNTSNATDNATAEFADRPFELPATGCIVITRYPARLHDWLVAQGAQLQTIPKPGDTAPAQDPDGATARVVTGARVYVGDPEQWQGAYGALPRLAAQLPTLAIGVGPAQWRALFREDTLPPPILEPGCAALWRKTDGRCQRVVLRDGLPEAFRQLSTGDRAQS